MTQKRTKKIIIALISVVVILAVMFSAFYGWSVLTAYKPNEQANAALEGSKNVTVTQDEYGIFFDGKGTETALIFYPGARVEYTCYAPLLEMLAQKGIDCFAVKMPFNMAFFGMDKADEIMDKYSYKHRYISGHSLGGAMAASYAAQNIDKLDGLILLAAYPTEKLEKDGFTVLSIYASEDKVLNMENFEAAREYMPKDHKEVCIEGGNHAWFGSYGVQNGDGVATISPNDQWERTAKEIKKAVS